MVAAKRVLYVLRHDPWGRGGGCYACRGYLEAFGEVFAGAAIDACVCAEYLVGSHTELFPGVRFIPVEPRSNVQRLMIPLTQVLHRHQSTVLRLLRERRYDYVVFDDNCIAGSLVRHCRKAGVRTVVINHNCEVEYFRDNMSVLKGLALLPAVRNNERRSYLECDINIFLTEEDRDTFARMYGKSRTRAVIGGCFLPRDEEISAQAERQSEATGRHRLTAVISGTIGNVQNMDGINFFLDELYPVLPTDIDVVITGQRPPEGFAKRLKAYARVTLVPDPDDILDVVRRADIFVCPTRLGGGMKLRIIDGLTQGLPVVAHRVSARGYTVFERRGMLRTYDTPATFARDVEQTVAALAAGTLRRETIAAAAREAFAFDTAVALLRDALTGQRI